MATATLIPRTVFNGSSSYLSITDSNNMLTNTSSSTYGTVRCTRQSTTSYYVYLRNFDFSLVPSNATVSNITIKVKGYHSGGNTGTLYMYNGTNSQVSACGSGTAFTTSSSVITFNNTTISWDTLKNYGSDFGMRINCRRNSSRTANTIYIYGAEIDVTYTAEDVHVTGVTLNKNSLSLEEGDTEQLTETVAPSNATDKSVSWSSSNTSVATVSSSGLVTAVSAGSATITVTTTDGAKTATCAVTVTQPSYTEYTLATSMTPGKTYLVANGNSGSVYLMSNEANGSRTLKGVAATVSNNKINVRASIESKCAFECVEYTSGNSVTTTLKSGSSYIYCDNASGLRFQTTSSLDRYWHYNNSKFWQFKSSTSDGYTDTSTEYKYYLTISNGNFTDNHVTSPSIEDSTLPAIYLFTPSSGSTEALYFKNNGSWVQASRVYKKVNGSWVEQSDLTNVFQSGINYVKGN